MQKVDSDLCNWSTHEPVGGNDGSNTTETLSAYLTALSRLHLIDNSEAWRPHIRSRARLRTAPVRYFVDPSLGPAALGVGTKDLMSDLNALGLHYEALVIRNLRIYAQPLAARVDSWRDSNGNEVDAVDEAARSLLRFKATVDTSRHGEPSCLGVITSTGAGGLREDGVHVIPIGCLGP
jgi:predicted AAA+ superfamily ATPase